MASASSSEIKTTSDFIHFVGTFTESSPVGFTSEKMQRLQLGSSMAPGSMTASSGEFVKSPGVHFGRFHILKHYQSAGLTGMLVLWRAGSMVAERLAGR